LPAEDQRRVEQLAAILRLAGGLDRSHSQQVKDATLQTDGDALKLLVKADFNPEVDLWGARRRVKLFRKVFGTKLCVEWEAEARSDGTQAISVGASRDGQANGDVRGRTRSKPTRRRSKR
jgi:hypothetical protein